MQRTFNKIGIVLRKNTPSIYPNARHIIDYLGAEGKEVIIDAVSHAEMIAGCKENKGKKPAGGALKEQLRVVPLATLGSECEVVIVIGGDGTLLTVAREIAPYDVPIIGVNRGRLGFLTQIPWGEETLKTIGAILAGEFILEERVILASEVMRENRGVHHALAVNEVTISRGGLGHLIEFEVFINQEFVYSQYSDGLIVATPTGSTAYSLAAGGPILSATLPVLTLVPICPQSMSNRPVVIAEKSDIEVVMVDGLDSRAHFDGQDFFELKNMDRVLIKRYPHTLKLLQPVYYHYFKTLRKKLRWGEQLV